MTRRELLVLLGGITVAATAGAIVNNLPEDYTRSPTLNSTVQPRPATGKYEVFGEDWCPWCTNVKDTLEANNVPFTFNKSSDYEEMFEEYNFVYIPQVFGPDGSYVGSYEETRTLLEAEGVVFVEMKG